MRLILSILILMPLGCQSVEKIGNASEQLETTMREEMTPAIRELRLLLADVREIIKDIRDSLHSPGGNAPSTPPGDSPYQQFLSFLGGGAGMAGFAYGAWQRYKRKRDKK